MTNPLLDTSSLPRFDEIAPEHVVPAVEHLINRNRQQLDELLGNPKDAVFNDVVVPVEEMDHELNRVWSPVRHLQSVLGSKAWRDAYNDALPLLTDYGTELSQNARLQQAFAHVKTSFTGSSSDAARSVVDHALRDFHLAGVDLPDAEKSRFKTIMQELAAAQAAFEHNIQDASDAWILNIADDKELEGVPEHAVKRAADEAQKRQLEGWALTLDYPTYDAVMTHADNRELRRKLYRAWSTRASDQGESSEWDNSANIEKILALRHEAAGLVGFDNYADYSLATKMAASTDEVISFLRELASRARAAAEKELAELRDKSGAALEPCGKLQYVGLGF